MSESPSIYMPRQLRPRRMPQSQNVRGESSRVTTSIECGAELQISSTHHHTNNYGILPPQLPRVVAKSSSQASSARQMDASIDSTRQRAATAVSISGFLGRQLHGLASQPYFSENGPKIYAYLLGYVDGDDSIYLNRLDQGIQHGTDRTPTAAHSTDIVIPLYRGLSTEVFYTSALRRGYIFRVSCLLEDTSTTTCTGPSVQFISIDANTRVTMEPALPIELDGMAGLLEHLHRGPNIGWGPLRRKGYKESYIYDCGLLLPPAHVVWVAGNSETDEKFIQSAYVDSGMPTSLHIALVYPEDSYRSARVRHFSAAPATGEPAIYIRLAAAELVSSSDISTVVTRFTSLDQCNRDLTRALYTAASQHRVSIAGQFERISVSPPQKHKSSPLLEEIVSSTKAIVTQSPRHKLPARARSPDMIPILQTKVGASSTPCIPAARSDGNVENSDISELLKEQRQIRMLLEQQNSLIKSHVSQTQELIRMTKHQPSPQTITRRYLRMRGTHTPSLLGIQRRTSDAGDVPTTGTTPENHSMRRSNSLSEIVDGIRSFEVEGYEETEHHVGHGYQRRLSFTSPMNVGSADLTLESPLQSPSVASGSLSASSGITSLVTRINRIVSTSTNMAPAASNAFERPPVPAYSRAQGRSHTYDHKITPTTQKYLDTL
ncbi:hypothetical protein COEREDRAFT_16842 [Coemansia reversa NRRL 1564]|uniref:Uncharacterized protein n=1 Tax=Coemansia reversa (strain ATCC 12441 / NRRL 1564) TaxID=763665 RepID=A0A2G5B619_COERN|nr:hypothetical protein COEREDRAFT_16842 [Coemansia reversa NRRL 1564]|eukprot:PIA14466.1 hypothetical protein COEREDRAFT_16842 [Coemansia reversa NRRL 1564]